MTFLEMVVELTLEAGIEGSGPVTTVGQTGVNQEIVKWIDRAYSQIQSKFPNWNFLRKSFLFQTSALVRSYSPDDAGITDHLRWELDGMKVGQIARVGFTIGSISPTVGDTITDSSTGATGVVGTIVVDSGAWTDGDAVGYFILTSSSGVFGNNTLNNGATTNIATSTGRQSFNDEKWLRYLNWPFFRDLRDFGPNAVVTGWPYEFTVHPDKSLRFWSTPDGIYTISGEYFRRAHILLDTADATQDDAVPLMPEEFHMCIVWRALMLYAGREHSPNDYGRGREEYKSLFSDLKADQVPPLIAARPLA